MEKNVTQSKYNPLFDPKTDNLPIDPQVQKETINEPKADPTGVNDQDQQFLQMLIAKIDSGEMHLYQPASIINQRVYATFDEKDQGRIDQNAVNLLAIIRQIKQLWDAGFRETFQIQNLVHQIRMTKERLEEHHGDIFII